MTGNPDYNSLFYYDTATGEWNLSGALNVVAGEGTLVVDGDVVTAATDLSGVTASAAEINVLDGIDATTEELNFVANVTPGTLTPSSAIVTDGTGAVDEIHTSALKVGASGSEVDWTSALGTVLTRCGDATIGAATAEAADARTVSIQLKDFLGADLAYRCSVLAYVSTDANGDTPGDGALEIVLTAGTDGSLLATDESGATFVSEADGDLDIVLTDGADGSQNVYLHIVLPTGEVKHSAVIAFVDDTP